MVKKKTKQTPKLKEHRDWSVKRDCLLIKSVQTPLLTAHTSSHTFL